MLRLKNLVRRVQFADDLLQRRYGVQKMLEFDDQISLNLGNALC